MIRPNHIIAIILFHLPLSLLSQNWVPLDKGVGGWPNVLLKTDHHTNTLWIYGMGVQSNNNGDTLNGIGAWNGTQISRLTATNNYYYGNCNEAYWLNDTLFISQFNAVPSFTYIKFFDPATSEFVPYTRGFNYNVFCEKFIDEKQYFLGIFDSCYSVPSRGIAKYSEGNWESLIDTLHSPAFGGVISKNDKYSVIEKFRGEYYVGGNFDGYDWNDQLITDFGILDNGRFKSVGSGFIPTVASTVDAMLVYKGELYIAGNFTELEGNAGNYIMRWDGVSLSDVGGGADNFISSLTVYNGLLFAAGGFDNIGGVHSPRIAYWNGQEWNTLGQDDFHNRSIQDMEIYNGELYISGDFARINSDSVWYVAKYNNQLPGTENEIHIYLNNQTEEVVIGCENTDVYDLSVKISSANGRLVREYSDRRLQGYSHHIIPIHGHASGVYIVDVIVGNNRLCKKLLKIR